MPIPDPVVREFLLTFWKIHILHHASEHQGVYGQWMLEEQNYRAAAAYFKQAKDHGYTQAYLNHGYALALAHQPQAAVQALEEVGYTENAAAIAVAGKLRWSHVSLALLKVRPLSDEFIEKYLVAEWPEVSQCVGVFRIEALGPQLFESIEGDMFTVLGMPLLPVLGALRELEELPA